MGANGKWEFLVPVAIAAAGLLNGVTPTSPDHTAIDTVAGEHSLAADHLVLEPSALASQVRHADHESHSSHSSHRSHHSSSAR